MQIISNYINDLKNISWISYDEINNKLFYQQNSIDANKNNRLSHIYELDMNNNKTSLSIDGEHNSIPKISPNGENLAYVKKNKNK
jgi:Tol biopolymer transport system component